MVKIALTGFTPFSTHLENPTEYLVRKFSSRPDINAVVVPVSYEKSGEEARRIEGDILLMTGLAAGRESISIEKCAYNERKASIPDSDGVLENGGRILTHGPEVVETIIDVEKIVESLKMEGLPSYVSEDPGRYVCNNIYYTALTSSKRPSLFVHFPSFSVMRKEDQEKALDIIIRILKEDYSPNT